MTEEISKRMELQPDACIRLAAQPDGSGMGEWIICGAASDQGGSTICYQAIHNNIRGRLKEFYPKEQDGVFYHLQRLSDLQLCPVGDGMTERFREDCEEFLRAYHILEQIKNEDESRLVLNNYMPSYRILYGYSEGNDTPGTVYIWTPGDYAGRTFEDYLQSIQSEAGIRPETHLSNILQILATLADCIGAFHCGDLLHLDLKPSNFLVLRDSENNIRPESISLFDINTICPADGDSLERIMGTPGYQAPEAAAGTPFFQSDIYSIGAMLLRALAGEDNLRSLYAGQESSYDYSVYEDLPRLVLASKLIESSESTSSPDMVEALITILQKTLHYQVFERYPDCYELKNDLLQAREILTQKISSGDVSEQDYLDSQPHALVDSTVVLQELLFRHPLYRREMEDGVPLNVLVLGAGTYGQKFLDLALQSGQMINHSLHIRAYSDAPAKNCRQYLQVRPALNQFVNVSSPELEVIPKEPQYDNYGHLEFLGLPNGSAGFPIHDGAAQRELLQQMLENQPQDGYHYVFIALGIDRLNREVAFALAEQINCPIHYVVHRETTYSGSGPRPVFISRSLPLKEIDPDLERQGFNTHLCWEPSLNVDIPKVRAKFKGNKYNYRSSLAYALSIPGKLASVGIYETDPTRAAQAFREVIQDRATFVRLVALEHRRWVLEKVTEGWRPPEKTDGIVNYDVFTSLGQTKDGTRKIHPCLVPSSEEMPLETFTRQQWRVPNKEDERLDPLDTMSVQLYRSFLNYASAFCKDQPMKKLNPGFILKKLEDAGSKAVQEYYRYEYCLQNIIDGNETYTRQLQTYAEKVRSAMEAQGIPESDREAVKNHMDAIKKMLSQVIEANLYKDYKKEDEKLVRMIPFILTYQVRPYMASVFTFGHSDNLKAKEILPNVASATVINPQKIIYLCYYDRTSRSSLLTKSLEAVLKYFRERGMACSIDFHLAFAPDVSESTQMIVRERLDAIRGKNKDKLGQVKYYLPEDAFQTGVLFAERLARNDRRIDLFDCSIPLFDDPVYNAQFLFYMQEKYPCFTFNRLSKTFPYTRNCDYLRYIDDRSFLRVNEIFTLTGTEQRKFEYPEFGETYKTLWEIYTGGTLNKDWPEHRRILTGIRNWTNLCNILLEYDKNNNPINEIGRIVVPQNQNRKNKYEFYLPDKMYAAMNLLMQKLEKQEKLVSYRLVSCGSDLCRLTVQSYLDLADALYKTIAYLYDHPNAILVVEGNAIATRTELAVKNLTLPSIHMLWVLQALERKHLINLLVRHDVPSDPPSFNDMPVVSFYYISDATKDLMTTAGKILEVYIYYTVKKAGYFDDIATSCEIYREDSDLVANELDCVLTKGMRSMIIECKATWQLEQGQYHKFHTVAEKTGLDSIKVFIANNLANEDDINWNQSYQNVVERNNELRSRGAEMGGIITIHDPLEIQNIGDTLRSIMEGTYPGLE